MILVKSLNHNIFKHISFAPQSTVLESSKNITVALKINKVENQASKNIAVEKKKATPHYWGHIARYFFFHKFHKFVQIYGVFSGDVN